MPSAGEDAAANESKRREAAEPIRIGVDRPVGQFGIFATVDDASPPRPMPRKSS